MNHIWNGKTAGVFKPGKIISGMKHWLLYVLVLLCVGCGSTPSHVIEPEKMARLLADVHMGESIIEGNRRDYESDSLKKTLKQSIYLKHDVTAQQVDTSFVWYGQHIEEYIKVYDRVIELLEDDIAQVKVSAEDVEMAVVGDSADAWSGLRNRVFTSIMPSNFLSFAINKDENWERGDVYQWKLKMLNNRSPLQMTLAVDYSDGSSEYNTAQGAKEGWHEIVLVSDTAKTAMRIYGVAHVNLKQNEYVYVDSISLLRTRHSVKDYSKRYNQKRFNYGMKYKGK